MRRLAMVSLLLGVVGVGVGQADAAGPCPTGPAAPTVERQRHGTLLRTRVTLCGRTFARGTYRHHRGVALLGAAAAPGQVAWVELRRRRRAAALLRFVLVDLSSRDVHTFSIGPRRSHRLPRVPVVVSTEGDVATIIARSVIVWHGGGGLFRAAGSTELRLEDDRTVTWRSAAGFRVHDLPRVNPRGTCPQRTGFTQVATDGRIVVTQGDYDPDERYATVVRACTIATGVERVMRIGNNGLDYGDDLDAIGVVGASVVMTNVLTGDKYDSGECAVDLIVRDISGAPLRTLPALPCTDPAAGALKAGVPLAVTASRGVVWVAATPNGTRVSAMTASGPRVLDPDGAGAITDLTAVGETVRWRRDGAERTATL